MRHGGTEILSRIEGSTEMIVCARKRGQKRPRPALPAVHRGEELIPNRLDLVAAVLGISPHRVSCAGPHGVVHTTTDTVPAVGALPAAASPPVGARPTAPAVLSWRPLDARLPWTPAAGGRPQPVAATPPHSAPPTPARRRKGPPPAHGILLAIGYQTRCHERRSPFGIPHLAPVACSGSYVCG